MAASSAVEKLPMGTFSLKGHVRALNLFACTSTPRYSAFRVGLTACEGALGKERRAPSQSVTFMHVLALVRPQPRTLAASPGFCSGGSASPDACRVHVTRFPSTTTTTSSGPGSFMERALERPQALGVQSEPLRGNRARYNQEQELAGQQIDAMARCRSSWAWNSLSGPATQFCQCHDRRLALLNT